LGFAFSNNESSNLDKPFFNFFFSYDEVAAVQAAQVQSADQFL
jgi:hypothetical protein